MISISVSVKLGWKVNRRYENQNDLFRFWNVTAILALLIWTFSTQMRTARTATPLNNRTYLVGSSLQTISETVVEYEVFCALVVMTVKYEANYSHRGHIISVFITLTVTWTTSWSQKYVWHARCSRRY